MGNQKTQWSQKKVVAPVATKSEAKSNYPSTYGSHASMVVTRNDNGTCICEDEYGEYETFINRLDNGTADPLRFDYRRRDAFLARVKVKE